MGCARFINSIFKYNLDDFILRKFIRLEFQFRMISALAAQLSVIEVAEICAFVCDCSSV